MSMLACRGITKSFGPVQVLHGIDLDVADREFVVLVGPSGCGKSTLLRLMAGLEDITSGELSIDGMRMNDVPPAERGLAMVFQSYALYPHMTVAQNMSVGLRIAKVDKATIRRKVEDAAAILQLTDLLDRLPRQLSGGQRQRVAIGRAIVRNPKIFLFDEPLSNLDAALRLQMRLELAKLRQDLKATMVYVTHDQVEAMTLADKIVVMNAGRIEQIGSPLDLYQRPANQFVAGFIGSPRMNFFDARVEAKDAGGSRLALIGGAGIVVLAGDAPHLELGQAVVLGIRPEHVVVAGQNPGGSRLGVAVSVVERLGSSTFAYGQIPSGAPITIELDGLTNVDPGGCFDVSLPGEQLHVFAASGQAMR